MDDLRDGLGAALARGHPTERKLAVVAVIAEAVQDLGVRPVVVGGLAVELWTYGEYATSDIDLLMPHLPEVDERMTKLGFRREGRHWTLPETDVFVEAPGSSLAPAERAVAVEVDPGRTVQVLDPVDVLIYRLHEFLGTGHADAAEQSVLLLGATALDRKRLAERAAEERLVPTLKAVERLVERVERGDEIEAYELHDIAQRLRAGR